MTPASSSSRDRPHRLVFKGFAGVSAAMFAMAACACSLPTPSLRAPEETVAAVRRAVSENDALLFLAALSGETLAEHETQMLVGWSMVREHLDFFSADIALVENIATTPEPEIPLPESAWVWPAPNKPARRVRARIVYRGEIFHEDFLFVQEIDATEENREGSFWIRVGEQWIPRAEHPNPERYAARARALDERKKWRLLYPYYPYQRHSELARRVMERMRVDDAGAQEQRDD